jgi:hypothetical protein
MAGNLSLAGSTIGALGIFFGFYFLSTDPLHALRLVTASAVGIVGVLAFLRHVPFHRSDAARLGWETDRPDWQFEVGFANLAFGLPALFIALLFPSYPAFFVLLASYSLYLGQAAALHCYRYLTDQHRSPARLWRSVVGTGLFAAMLGVFAFRALCG